MAAGAGVRPAPRWLKALAEPLNAAQLRRLEEHRYTAAGVSLLEPPLQLYWTWLLQWIPLWMAPNSITLLGLAINLLTTLLLISYCPTVTEEVGPPPARGPPTALPRSPAAPARAELAPPRVRLWRRPESPPRGRASRGRGGANPASAPAPQSPRPFPGPPEGCHAATRSHVHPEPPPDGGGAVKVTAQSRVHPHSPSGGGRAVSATGSGSRLPAWPPPHPAPSGSFAHWALNTPSSVPPGSGDCGWVGQARDALWTLLYSAVRFSKVALVIL